MKKETHIIKSVKDTFPYAVNAINEKEFFVECPDTITATRVIGACEYIERAMHHFMALESAKHKSQRVLTREQREMFAVMKQCSTVLKASFYADWYKNTKEEHIITEMRKAVDRMKRKNEIISSIKHRIFRFLKIGNYV